MDLPSCSAQRKVKDPPKPRSTRIAWLGWGGAGRCGIVTCEKCWELRHLFWDSIQFLSFSKNITCWSFHQKKHIPSSMPLPTKFQVVITPTTTTTTIFPTFPTFPLPTSTPGDAKLSNPGGVAATFPKEPMLQDAMPSPRGDADGVPASGDTSPTERRRPVSVMEWTLETEPVRKGGRLFGNKKTILRNFCLKQTWKKG